MADPPSGWPNATTTGPAAGTVFTDYAGPADIPPGTYVNRRFPTLPGDAYRTTGPGLWTFTDCLFNDGITCRFGTVNMTRCEITQGGLTLSAVAAATVLACDLHNAATDQLHITADAGPCTDVRVEDSYLHTPTPVAGTEQCDGIHVRGCVGLTIRHNSIDLGTWFTVGGNNVLHSGLFLDNANGGNTDVVVKDNWLNGGGYDLTLGPVARLKITGTRVGVDAQFGHVDPAGTGTATLSNDNRVLATNAPIAGLPDIAAAIASMAAGGKITVSAQVGSGGTAGVTSDCEPWPLRSECLPKGWLPNPPQWTDAQRDAVTVATELLKTFSGGQYGLCRAKVRPCKASLSLRPNPSLPGGPWMTPVLLDGRLINLGCACVNGACACAPPCEVELPGIVHDIVEVRMDGQVVPPTAYRVDEHRMLVRTDGGCWPLSQNLELPDTATGTWSVTYRRGVLPGPAGELALTLFAVELYNACHDTKNCALPRRVSQVVRDGITYDLLDDLTLFDRSRTGIPRVDMWLASVNPHGARTQMRVWSPDLPSPRQTTWPR